MLAALLANLRPPGGIEFPWLKSQAEHDRLLRDDEDILALITTLVTSDILND